MVADRIDPGLLAELETVARIGADLEFVLVTGPDYHSSEAFQFLRGRVCRDRRWVWHELDSAGTDLVEALGRDECAGAIIAVDGLDRLWGSAREAAVAHLNLQRDVLPKRGALVLLWVPTEMLAWFSAVAADLYHWRSLVVTLSEADLELSVEQRARKACIVGTIERAVALTIDTDRHEAEARRVIDVLVPGHVVGRRGETVELESWRRTVERGVIVGGVGAGKSVALATIALAAARKALRSAQAPIPLLVPSDLLAQRPRIGITGEPIDPLFSLALMVTGFPDIEVLQAVGGGLLRHWCRVGKLLFLIDVAGMAWDNHFTAVAVELARLAETSATPVVVAAPPWGKIVPSAWQQRGIEVVTLAPWSPADARRYGERVHADRRNAEIWDWYPELVQFLARPLHAEIFVREIQPHIDRTTRLAQIVQGQFAALLRSTFGRGMLLMMKDGVPEEPDVDGLGQLALDELLGVDSGAAAGHWLRSMQAAVVEPQGDRVRVVLPLLQAFLAALRIARENRLDLARAHADAPAWRAVLLILGGWLANSVESFEQLWPTQVADPPAAVLKLEVLGESWIAAEEVLRLARPLLMSCSSDEPRVRRACWRIEERFRITLPAPNLPQIIGGGWDNGLRG